MAGNFAGTKPANEPRSDFSGRPLIHGAATTRTRLLHGAWAAGATVAAVHSAMAAALTAAAAQLEAKGGAA